DAYAMYRNEEVSLNGRYGKTISIDWPLWKEGGMRVDPESEISMTRRIGMKAMEIKSGILAFYRCLTLKKDQVMVMEGNIALLRRKLLADDAHANTENENRNLKVKENNKPVIEMELFRGKAE